MEIISINNRNARLNTIVYHSAKTETILLLHGGPGVPEDFGILADILSAFRVITFHQRGTALSPVSNKDYSVESHLSDIDAVADYFSIQKFHLFGHSWGGLYAQIYASKRKDRIRSLFLCSPVPGTQKQWKESQIEILRYNKRKSTFSERIIMGVNSSLGILGSDRAMKKLFEQSIITYNRGFKQESKPTFLPQYVKAAPVNSIMMELMQYPLPKKMISPSFKITITYGTDDTIGESRKYLFERYPTASVVIIPDSGHIPWIHNKEAFNKILLNHFDLTPEPKAQAQ